MIKHPRDWKNKLLENGSYKLVALFVTMILWVTILGRRELVLSKDVDLEFLLPPNLVISEQMARAVSVKVSGPRMATKKFAQNPGVITIDLGRSPPGRARAVITPRNVDVPFGVRVISVTPSVLELTLVQPGSEKNEK